MNNVTIIDKLREAFPQAEVTCELGNLFIKFAKTHVSTEAISKIEEIVFHKGSISVNSKELVSVKNGTVCIKCKWWNLFDEIYHYLIELDAKLYAADITDNGIIIQLSPREFLNYSQLEVLQGFINKAMGVHIVEHDSIRIFGCEGRYTMSVRLH